MAFTPPRIRRQHYVAPGVKFVHAISSSVIWEVDQQVSIGEALCEIGRRAGVDIGQIKLLNECGPVSFMDDIDEAVISVVLLSK